MHSTQNERINQITFSTLIIGVDISKFKHGARAQDNRGVEFGKSITFENNRQGCELFVSWIQKTSIEQDFQDIIDGMEPTGVIMAEPRSFSKRKACKIRCSESAVREEKQRTRRQFSNEE